MESEFHVRRPALLGGLLFIVSAPVHFVVTQDVSIAIAAVTLGMIGGAYIGFGAQASDSKTLALELLVAVLFGMAALAGLLWHWIAIPLGLALHAIWDLLHHKPIVGARVPRWYIPFCVIYDLSAAFFLVMLYAF
ncbi:hypothetical protein C7964_10848 [Loktanella sp. PT4BL]|jgi:hypothetical protein|uniref:DUF6010 family protein n=1 Tax=Loktanella sp. PT4BL TaxID=2135611 RepID=UPI000D773E4F|nr:DUF6010 family protein [Loktanella sp. PT4BL]PXW67218.1 hypothetical protein C7964_10848 [Loktanella sp. PT4BL]